MWALSRVSRSLAVSALVLSLAILAPSPARAADDGDGRFGGFTGASNVNVFGAGQAASQGAPTSAYNSTAVWVRHPICIDWFAEEFGTGGRNPGRWENEIPNCALGETNPGIVCPDGAEPLDPWWVGRPAGTIDRLWLQASGYQCAAVLLEALVADAWDRMPIAPNTYTVQPSTGYAVADLGVVLAIDRNPRQMTTTLLGTNVIIRAIPTSYSWSASDGSRWSSSGAGATYESGGAPHTFAPEEQRLTFTLTTTWRGEFSTNGGSTWREAPGTATTTSATTTLHVYHPHNHGIDCTLTGECASGGDDAGNTQQLIDPDGDGIANYLIPDAQIDAYLDARGAGSAWTGTARKTPEQIAGQTDGR